MLLANIPHPITITEEMLVNRTFTFRSETADATISETFLLSATGLIAGYSHPNERTWDIRDNCLRIIDQHGNATCHLHIRPSELGIFELAGHFRDPSNGYQETHVVHTLQDMGSDYHLKIQSFDLFDTLVARRCFEPLAVFRNVEEKSGVLHFAARRHAVEMSMFGRQAYGLEEIYALLIAERLITEHQAQVLKAMELEEEWEMLFPIAEIISHVKPDDIIISDMYLPREFIERVLREKCGLDNKLYLSNYGKHHRTIWPEIKDTHSIRAHFGDNWHADVVGASEAGIQPMFVSISKWNQSEEILRACGLEPYAHALRELRLETFHDDLPTLKAIQAQVAINLPLLLLGSFWINQTAKEFGADKILACARDSNFWNDILSSKHLARYGMPITHYTSISRFACLAPSPDYEAYFLSHLGRKNLLIDVVGTGRSLTTLIDRLQLSHRIQPCVLVADQNTSAVLPNTKFLLAKEFTTHRLALEMLNTSSDGSTIGAMSDGARLQILKQPVEYSASFIEIMRECRIVSDRFIAILDKLPALQNLPQMDVIRSSANAIADQLPPQLFNLQAVISEFNDNIRVSS
jgi:hypothetical protein